jgi:hypothetical protein
MWPADPACGDSDGLWLCGLKSPGSRLRPPCFGDVTFFYTVTAPPRPAPPRSAPPRAAPPCAAQGLAPAASHPPPQPSKRFKLFWLHLKGLYGGLHFTLALLLLFA